MACFWLLLVICLPGSSARRVGGPLEFLRPLQRLRDCWSWVCVRDGGDPNREDALAFGRRVDTEDAEGTSGRDSNANDLSFERTKDLTSFEAAGEVKGGEDSDPRHEGSNALGKDLTSFAQRIEDGEGGGESWLRSGDGYHERQPFEEGGGMSGLRSGSRQQESDQYAKDMYRVGKEESDRISGQRSGSPRREGDPYANDPTRADNEESGKMSERHSSSSGQQERDPYAKDPVRADNAEDVGEILVLSGQQGSDPDAKHPSKADSAGGGESPVLSGHQGSDPYAKDPTGIWSSFQRVPDEQDGGESALRSVCSVWGQASCQKRSQAEVEFRLTGSITDGIVAHCVGTPFCGKQENEGHHIMCCCTSGPPSAAVRVPLTKSSDDFSILKGSAVLTPGRYTFKFENASGEAETLHGMWGVEDHRLLTVLSPPKPEAILLVSDIDGTLIGEQEFTDKFFWFWNEQYRPRGAHLVYNTGRPFDSAHDLIRKNRLHPPTALVCSEGTEIYWFGPLGAEDVTPDHEWREILMLSWDYTRIKEGVQEIVEKMRHEVNEAQYLPEVNGQPMIVISVADKGKADHLIGKINHHLRQSQQLKFDMTCSSGGGHFFILIVPRGASKGSAAIHVSNRLGFAPDRVMVAGDGENDVPLFEATFGCRGKAGFRGTIVSNAAEGLKSWVARTPSAANIHWSVNPQGLGVLEGLEAHFPKVHA